MASINTTCNPIITRRKANDHASATAATYRQQHGAVAIIFAVTLPMMTAVLRILVLFNNDSRLSVKLRYWSCQEGVSISEGLFGHL